MLPGSTGSQTVGIPELVDDGTLFQSGGDLLLLQQTAGTFHVQDILVLLLRFPLGTGLGSFRFRTGCQNSAHMHIHFFRIRIVLSLTGLKLADFLFQTIRFSTDGFHQGDLLLTIAFHGSAQILQILDVIAGGCAFRIQRRFLGFQFGHLTGDDIGCFSSLCLAAFQHFQFVSNLRQLLGIYLNLRTLGSIALPIGAFSCQQRIFFTLGGFFRFLDGIEQNFMLLFHTLQAQHLILRFTELITGGGQLEFHLICQPLGFLQVGIHNEFLILQVFFLFGELFQLIGTGEDTCILIHTTAGHGAAGID